MEALLVQSSWRDNGKGRVVKPGRISARYSSLYLSTCRHFNSIAAGLLDRVFFRVFVGLSRPHTPLLHSLSSTCRALFWKPEKRDFTPDIR